MVSNAPAEVHEAGSGNGLICWCLREDGPKRPVNTGDSGSKNRKPHESLENSWGSYDVGATGFEPATPRPPVWCASQAALRPEKKTSITNRMPRG